MGTQGDRIFQITAERGFPDPWLSFGDALCDEARYATEAMRLIAVARKDATPANQDAVRAQLQKKADNIQHCADILTQVRHDYDQTGMWEQLDDKARRLDIADVLGTWARTQELHPYPMVLKSLEFNWTYMKEHGVKAFYEMTSEYVGKLIQNTAT